MQIHLFTLGCRLNEAELESWSTEFLSRGHQIVNQPEAADVIVLNSCAVTQEAVRKSRKSIQRLHRSNPTAKMVVSGCFVSLAGESGPEPLNAPQHVSMHDNLGDSQETASASSLASSLGVDLIVSNENKDHLVALTEQLLAPQHLSAMPVAATQPAAASLFQRNRQRAFIKIQDGCRYRCTFCIVTVARGIERSRTIPELIAQINQLDESGIKEVVLTGVHVGGYGSDLDTSLFLLVTAILAETSIPRIRFASVEPWDLPEDFFSLFENPRLMPHMHLPLQSGSDSVLKRMARRCKTPDFLQLVQDIRSSIPQFNITTDIIVGFPGETEQEWQESLRFIESIEFGHIHIFSYSVREGTKAARLPGQIHRSVKRERSQTLHALASRAKRRVLETTVGQTAQILWESGKPVANGVEYAGYTPNYLRITTRVDEGMVLQNAITQTHIASISSSGDHLSGTVQQLVSGPSLINCTETVPSNAAYGAVRTAEMEPQAAFMHKEDIIRIKAVPPRTSTS